MATAEDRASLLVSKAEVAPLLSTASEVRAIPSTSAKILRLTDTRGSRAFPTSFQAARKTQIWFVPLGVERLSALVVFTQASPSNFVSSGQPLSMPSAATRTSDSQRNPQEVKRVQPLVAELNVAIAHRLGDRPQQGRVHRGGAKQVRSNVIGPVLERHAPGQAQERVFGRDIGRHFLPAAIGERRACIHDRSAAPADHVRNRVFSQQL